MAEQRYRAVLEVIAQGRGVSEVASQWGVSRQTMHAWLVRYEAGGLEGLGDRSHRPASCSHQMPAVVQAAAVPCSRRSTRPPTKSICGSSIAAPRSHRFHDCHRCRRARLINHPGPDQAPIHPGLRRHHHPAEPQPVPTPATDLLPMAQGRPACERRAATSRPSGSTSDWFRVKGAHHRRPL